MIAEGRTEHRRHGVEGRACMPVYGDAGQCRAGRGMAEQSGQGTASQKIIKKRREAEGRDWKGR